MPHHGTAGRHDRKNCKNPNTQIVTRDADNGVGAMDEQSEARNINGQSSCSRLPPSGRHRASSPPHWSKTGIFPW